MNFNELTGCVVTGMAGDTGITTIKVKEKYVPQRSTQKFVKGVFGSVFIKLQMWETFCPWWESASAYASRAIAKDFGPKTNG